MTEICTSCTNSVFEEAWWLDTVAPGKWREATVKEGDKVIARLPYYYDNGVITNPVYTQTMGIWMDDSLKSYSKGNSQLHRQKEIIFELLEQLPKTKRISMILDHNASYILPFRWAGFRIEPTFSYRIKGVNLIDPKEDLFGKTVKKNIKAASRGVSIDENTSDFSVLLDMQNRTYARQHRKNPIREDITRKVMESAYRHGHGKLLIARGEDGVPHSAGFFLFDERTCYYLLGGFDPAFNSDGSQNLLLDAGIRFAQSVSADFDFEGSMVEGIENFYRQFGGSQVINYQVSKQLFVYEMFDVLKPRIKKLIGYKI